MSGKLFTGFFQTPELSHGQKTTESDLVVRNYTCEEEKTLKILNNDSLMDYLKQCPSTKKIDVSGQTKMKISYNVSIKSLDPSENIQISLWYISEVNFDDEDCSRKFQLE